MAFEVCYKIQNLYDVSDGRSGDVGSSIDHVYQYQVSDKCCPLF